MRFGVWGSYLLCAVLVTACLEEADPGASTISQDNPPNVNQQLSCEGGPLQVGIIRVAPTALAIDSGTSVLWQVVASGCGGRYRLQDSSDTFSESTRFTKAYFDSGTVKEKVSVSAVTASGSVIQTVNLDSSAFQVVAKCIAPLAGTLTKISPSTPVVDVQGTVTWEVRGSGCTGIYKIPNSTSFFAPSVRFTKTYNTVGTFTESIPISSLDASGNVVSTATVTNTVDIVKCSVPLRAALTRVSPISDSVVQGTNVRWQISATGCAGIYRIAGSDLFGASTEFTKTYAEPGSAVETVTVSAMDPFGNVLETVDASANLHVSCATQMQVGLTRLSPDPIELGASVNWRVSASGCSGSYKLQSKSPTFSTTSDYSKTYAQLGTNTETVQVSAVDRSGNVLQTAQATASLQVIQCVYPFQPKITQISPVGPVEIGSPVTWEVSATGCQGSYKVGASTFTSAAPARYTTTYADVGMRSESIQVSALDTSGTIIQSLSLTSNIEVTACAAPFSATLTRISPQSVEIGNVVTWEVAATGCKGSYKVGTNTFFSETPYRYTKTYSQTGPLTEKLDVSAVNSSGLVLQTVSATATLLVATCDLQATLTKLSPEAPALDELVTWQVAASGCTGNYQLGNGTKFTSAGPVIYTKQYSDTGDIAESMQVSTLDAGGGVLKTVSVSSNVTIKGCNIPLELTLKRVSPTTSSVEPGTSVTFELEAKGGCAAEYIIGNSTPAPTFTSKVQFSRTYDLVGTYSGYASVTAFDSKHRPTGMGTATTPYFQVVSADCPTNAVATLTLMNPGRIIGSTNAAHLISLGETKTWEVAASGCTGSYQLTDSNRKPISPVFTSKIQFTKTYNEATPRKDWDWDWFLERVYLISVNPKGEPIQFFENADKYYVLKGCTTPLNARINRISPLGLSVVPGTTVTYEVVADGCGATNFRGLGKFTQTYKQSTAAAVESRPVWAFDASGELLEIATAKSDALIVSKCDNPMKVTLTKLSPASTNVEIGTDVTWQLSAQGCSGNFKSSNSPYLSQSTTSFTSLQPIQFTKKYYGPGAANETQYVFAVDGNGAELDVMTATAGIQVNDCAIPVKASLKRISPLGPNVEVGTPVTWQLSAQGCFGRYSGVLMDSSPSAGESFPKSSNPQYFSTSTEIVANYTYSGLKKPYAKLTVYTADGYQVKKVDIFPEPLESIIVPVPKIITGPTIPDPNLGFMPRVLFGDFTGDGGLDRIYTSNTGSLLIDNSNWDPKDPWIFTGQFFKNSQWAGVFDARSTARFFAGDFNHDGYEEVVFTYSDGNVWGILSKPDTSVAAEMLYSNPALGTEFDANSRARFFSGDFNGDGKADLLFTRNNGTVTALVSNATDNKLAASTIFSKSSWGGVFDAKSGARFFSGDFNGDGRLDLAFTWPDGNVWGLLSSTQDSVLHEKVIYNAPAWGTIFNASSLARFFAGDYNGDKKTDLLFTWTDGSIIGIYSTATDEMTSQTQAIFKNADWGSIVFASNSNARFYSGDFNADGKRDLMFAYTDGNVFTLESNAANNNLASKLVFQGAPHTNIVFGRILPRDFRAE